MFKVINTYYEPDSISPIAAIKRIVGEEADLKKNDEFSYKIAGGTRSYIVTPMREKDTGEIMFRIDECLEFNTINAQNAAINCAKTGKLIGVHEGALRAPNSALKL